jgi:hypothetical protein
MRVSLLTGLLFALSTPALADSPWEIADTTPRATVTRASFHTLKPDYSAAINRHRLDSHTRVIGWRFGDSWYFGRQKGGIGGLALVWQGDRKQMTVSTEGLRLIRRF